MAQSASSEGGHLDEALTVNKCMAWACYVTHLLTTALLNNVKTNDISHYSLHFPTVSTIVITSVIHLTKKDKNTINKVKNNFTESIFSRQSYSDGV